MDIAERNAIVEGVIETVRKQKYVNRCNNAVFGRDDAEQEALLKIMTSLDEFDPARGTPEMFAKVVGFGGVHQALFQNISKSGTGPKAADSIGERELSDGRGHPSDRLTCAYLWERLLPYTTGMPPTVVRTLKLHIAHGMDFEEIARLTDRKRSSVITAVGNGFVQFRKNFEKEGVTVGDIL